MCTLVLLRRPGHAWPLLLAANRDEMLSRPWRPPERHWPDRPEVVAGQDELAGGSWLGINDHGVVAAVLNRRGSLGPAAGKRSRGELVLDALNFEDAASAAAALADLDPDAYRPFNLIVADPVNAYWLRHAGGLPGFGFRAADGTWREVEAAHMPREAHGAEPPPSIETRPVPDGLSMITARDLNDPASARNRLHRPRFQAAPLPDPDTSDWSGWIACLASRDSEDGDPTNAMTIVTGRDYGTVCSSLVALPKEGPPKLWFAAGRPDQTPFEVVLV
ncbi:MAG TPA: NRDE family protein [Geminicoccaceae bacterium]